MTLAPDGFGVARVAQDGNLSGVLHDGMAPDEVRAIVDDWVRNYVPREWAEAASEGDLAELHRVRTPVAYRRWYPRLGGSGMTAPDWPSEFGGLGLSVASAGLVLEHLRRWRLTRLNIVGLSLIGPTLLQSGSAEQRTRYLPTIANNAEPWCQLFSEPGAGSDLAGMSTLAQPTEAGWRISGQKVWTSFAVDARWGLLIARTDPDLPKHAGLTAFVCDMTAPAVEVRPLRKITGDSEFSEVFIDGLLVADAGIVGARGDGWRIAQDVLKHERQMLAGSGAGATERTSGGSIESIVQRAAARRSGPGRLLDDETFRGRLTDLWVESVTIRMTNQRAAQLRRSGQSVLHPSAQKLMQSEHNQRLQLLALDSLGGDVVAYESGDAETAAVVYGFLRSRGDTIAGGTSEIQRNIVAERALGLPKDPFDDNSIPWRDIRRGPG
jgi:alkylation response protein AidB-like acyl-CoA dehydrogenase